MKKSDLIKFFNDRPSIYITSIGEEAGYKKGEYPRKCFRDLADSDELPPRLAEKLLPVLVKYGWK